MGCAVVHRDQNLLVLSKIALFGESRVNYLRIAKNANSYIPLKSLPSPLLLRSPQHGPLLLACCTTSCHNNPQQIEAVEFEH